VRCGSDIGGELGFGGAMRLGHRGGGRIDGVVVWSFISTGTGTFAHFRRGGPPPPPIVCESTRTFAHFFWGGGLWGN
jgi:hypothetical protein